MTTVQTGSLQDGSVRLYIKFQQSSCFTRLLKGCTEICKMSCSLSQIYCYFSQMSIWFICEVMREKLLGENKQNRTLLNNTPACSVGFLRVFEREVLSRLNLCRPNDTSFVFLTPMGLLEELCGRLRCESFSADGLVPFSEPPPL